VSIWKSAVGSLKANGTLTLAGGTETID